MNTLGRETNATAALIAFGLLGAILSALLFYNFWWGVRIMRAFRRGEGVIARWVVRPATFDLFRSAEARLKDAGDDNDYRVPRRTPANGVEVAFSEDGVLIGDTFFGLASTGLGRFTSIRYLQTNPPCLEFGTVLSSAVSQPRVQIVHSHGVLRVPIGHDGQTAAARVLTHFQDVIARRKIVKPEFWSKRIRIGWWGMAMSIVAAATGLLLRERNEELSNIPLFLAVCGAVCTPAFLILAAVTYRFHQRQHHG